MTNGEVYALLRRRRDERNAARHPPFGLQPPPAEGHQRAPVSTGAAAAAAAAAAATAAPSARSSSAISSAASVASNSGMKQQINSKSVPAGAIESASAAAAASTASILASPSSAHLVVLLTEVTMLNYIANHSSFQAESMTPSATAQEPADGRGHTFTPRDLYGPTGSEGPSSDALRGLTAAAHALVDAGLVSSLYAKLAAHRPGTRGHVSAVEELLEHFEEVGRAQERSYAEGVRCAVQQLWRRRLCVPAGGPYPQPCVSSAATVPSLSNGTAFIKTEPIAEEDLTDDTTEALQRSSLAARQSLASAAAAATTTTLRDAVIRQGGDGETIDAAEGALPTALSRTLAPLLLEPTPLWGPAARGGGGRDSADVVGNTADTAHKPLSCRMQLQQQQVGQTLLSEAEVLQLVVGRPQRALDVYRIVDDVDGRLQYNEEAVEAFVEAVTAVFGGGEEGECAKN
ncbi:hypothetical protein JKF63_07765 [Porcisia hertigi]|uniref:Uncharacterized protein n=1 Tax=Porcisia hertigi TaxID=2761500 RepID=A0A836LLW2_9TRYP|nr:hypothetical protein JKF63_07765 [Porcisia hertigi]